MAKIKKGRMKYSQTNKEITEYVEDYIKRNRIKTNYQFKKNKNLNFNFCEFGKNEKGIIYNLSKDNI